jgi:hypothetical protein
VVQPANKNAVPDNGPQDGKGVDLQRVRY